MTPRDKTLFTDTMTGVQKIEDNLDQIFSMLRKHSLDSLEISYQNQYFHRRVGADAFR
jgi:hypothetical protein